MMGVPEWGKNASYGFKLRVAMEQNMNANNTPLSAADLMAAARQRTGIDREDELAEKALPVLCQSLSSESGLHEKGQIVVRDRILRYLSNRLRMFRDFDAHPEILKQKIEAPLIVCGIMRTGSTKTHRLLAASGDYNWLPLWQGLSPALVTGARNEDPQPRIDIAEDYCEWFNRESPELRHVHTFSTFEPDEDTFLFKHSLLTSAYFAYNDIPSYTHWLLGQDLCEQIRFTRDALKYLQWQGLAEPGKRWVLKSPLYCGMEPLLLEVFPDARIIMTHRHPAQTVPSTCSLVQAFHQPQTDQAIDFEALATGLGAQMEQHLAGREAVPSGNIMDLDYQTVANDSMTLLEEVYRLCNQSPGENAIDNVRGWELAHPKHKAGKHQYSLEQFGLNKTFIENHFSSYIDFYSSLYG